jgi:hypothetical protein
MRSLRCAATALALAAAVTSTPTAAADPVLSTDAGAPAPTAETPADPDTPAPPPPPVAGGAGAGILSPSVNLGPNGVAELLLGQSAVPAAPGSPPAITMAAPPQYITDGSTFLNTLNFAYPGADVTNPYQLGQGDINAPGRLNSFKGARGLFHAVMGKLNPNQLGNSPDTAPPPGTASPPGTGSTVPDQSLPAPPPRPEGAPAPVDLPPIP